MNKVPCGRESESADQKIRHKRWYNVTGLDPSPFGLQRPAQQRMFGFCYHTDLNRDDFQDGGTARNQCRAGASMPALYGNREPWRWDELLVSLVNDVAAFNKVEVVGWYWCDRLKVELLDQPHDETDASLDILARLAATAESVEGITGLSRLGPTIPVHGVGGCSRVR